MHFDSIRRWNRMLSMILVMLIQYLRIVAQQRRANPLGNPGRHLTGWYNHVDLVGLFCRSHGPSGCWENYVFPCERDTDLNLTPHARRCYLDFTSCIQHDRTLRRGVFWSRPIAVTWKIGAQGTVLEPETLTEHDFCDNGGHNLGARKELLLRVSWMQCLSEQATLVDSR